MACSSSYECNSALGLQCPLYLDTCNCPLASSYVFCDCLSIPNNEFYWNGTSCQAAESYGQSCSNASNSYMCQKQTQGTICNNSAGSFVCECAYLQYFDYITNSCRGQLSINETCIFTGMCLSIYGLSCISGLCRLVSNVTNKI